MRHTSTFEQYDRRREGSAYDLTHVTSSYGVGDVQLSMELLPIAREEIKHRVMSTGHTQGGHM